VSSTLPCEGRSEAFDQAKIDSRRDLDSVKEINGMFDCREIERRM
jgi:hypothetical protein